MKRILAIASIAIRNAVRSRMVISLLVLLLVVVAGIPLSVQGDGTLEGHVRIVIGYTMGFASLLLGLAALWAGALSVSQEIAERQIQMLAAKPVHRFQIWLGKWLGLMAVNTLLLAASGAATYGLLRWTTQPSRMAEAERNRLMDDVLAAHRPVAPRPVDLEATARFVLEDRLKQGELPDDVAPARALKAIRQELLLRASTVEPGARRDWVFQLPPDAARAPSITLRYRFSSSQFGLDPLRGLWLAGPPSRPEAAQLTVTNAPGVAHELVLSGRLVPEDGVLAIGYVNNHPTPITVVFDPVDGVQIRVPAGGFEGNFARALLMVLTRLAFLTAVGVAAGTLFSTPVAAFMSMAMVLLLQLSGYVDSLTRQAVLVPWHDAEGAGPTWLDHLLRLFFQGLHLLLAPLAGPDAMDAAATGLLVDPIDLLRAVLVQVVLYGGALALFSTYVFNRRELALPST